jgi:hypothetical protein
VYKVPQVQQVLIQQWQGHKVFKALKVILETLVQLDQLDQQVLIAL